MAALNADAQAAFKDFQAGRITESRWNHIMSRAEAEAEKIETAYETRSKALSMRANTDSLEWNKMTKFDTAGGFAACSKAKQVSGLPSGAQQVSRGLSPTDLDDTSMQDLFTAMSRRQPVRLELKSFGQQAHNKTAGAPITEGTPSFSGLLPPVLRPDMYVDYRFDIVPRIADYFPTIEIDSQEIALPVEGEPTNPVVPAVSELGTKVDLGANWTTKSFRPVKMAVLGSISMEAVSDMPIFSSLLPATMSNALFSAEAQQILYGNGSSPNMTGLANTAGILSLPISAFMYQPLTDTVIDGLVNACTVLREQPNFFAEADLILLNPSDWSGIRRTKDSDGRYVLSIANPSTELANVDNLFGVPVVVSTQVNPGEAFVLNAALSTRYIVRQSITVETNMWSDTFWANNEVGWRVEQRSCLAVIRPQGVIHVTSLGADGS
jgi:HK97 family phage major capsid protein